MEKRYMGRWNLPGQSHEFPPWVVSAYRIAVKHGFRGTEGEFRLSLCGRDGVDMLPMLLVTTAPEEEIPEEYEMIMRPSPDDCAYYTEKNEFRMADQIVCVPDGMNITGRILSLACEGEAFGKGVELPDPSTVLPEVTASDNGKILKVAAGEWSAQEI